MGRRRTQQPATAFGRFLEAQLAQLHLTPTEFAARAELNPSHVYQMLRGARSDPRGTTLHKIAAALGLSETQLTRAGGVSMAGSVSADMPDTAAAVDRATFFGLMSGFPSGVTIVTTLDEHAQPRGLTCTATCALSAEPPLLLVCIDRRSRTLAAVRRRRRFIVNYLYAGREDLSNRFASSSSDRWTGLAWQPTPSGLPWLHTDSLAYVECSVVSEVDGGDHMIVVGRIEGGRPPLPGTLPLIYFRRSYVTVGPSR